MIDRDWLSSVIASPHLEPDNLAHYAREFESHPARLLVLPEFLRGEIAGRLMEFLATDAVWSLKRQLYSSRLTGATATPQEWEAAPESDRFFQFRTGELPSGRLSGGIAACIRFYKALRDDRMRELFEAFTATRLEAVVLTMHAMQTGDFLRKHDDTGEGRRLAFILYLTPDWRPEFGGQLCIESRDHEIFTLEPEYNSLVIFDVEWHASHWVEPIQRSANDLPRLSIGGWFGAGTSEKQG